MLSTSNMIARLCLPTMLVPAILAQSPSVIVPAIAATSHGNSNCPMPGAGYDCRLQVIVDEGHFDAAFLGREIIGITLRREDRRAGDAPGGVVNLVVRIGRAAAPAANAHENFAQNFALIQPTGGVPTVFDAPLQLASSPAPGPTSPSWSTLGDAVHITLSQPYHYTGGPLCIDIEGRAVPGSAPGPWTLDGVAEDTRGTTTYMGRACGTTGEIFVHPAELIAGHTVAFSGKGPALGNAVLFLGQPLPAFDLSLLGLSAPGCELLVDPIVTIATTYAAASTFGATMSPARTTLQLPSDASVLAAELRAQYVTLQYTALSTSLETSDAVTCRLAAVPPSGGIASVYARSIGTRTPTSGRVWSARGPVLGFDFAP